MTSLYYVIFNTRLGFLNGDDYTPNILLARRFNTLTETRHQVLAGEEIMLVSIDCAIICSVPPKLPGVDEYSI